VSVHSALIYSATANRLMLQHRSVSAACCSALLRIGEIEVSSMSTL
jgi:hypothetical protein